MNILIVGCGYLGTEVGKRWSREKGVHVTATTRSVERLSELSSVVQKSVLLRSAEVAELEPLIALSDLILVSIAADDVGDYTHAYLHTAEAFCKIAHHVPHKRLFYTSSTSVYGDREGMWVDETTLPMPVGEPAKILAETERLFLSLTEFGWKVTVFRLGEIYGPQREIHERLRRMEHHTLPGKGENYTNMIHVADAAGAIDYAKRHQLTGIYNLVDDDHMTRKELYQKVARQHHLRLPPWDGSHPVLHSGNKRVSNHKIKADGYPFEYPHRVV